MTGLEAALTCLAMNIYFEARSENFVGQLAVAQVTLNRVEDERYPDNICDVVWEPKQFSWTHDGKSDKMRDTEARETAYSIADLALNGGRVAFIDDATHYHATYVSPWWIRAKSLTYRTRVGNHLFYYEEPVAN